MQRNIKLLYAIRTLRAFFLIMPVIVPFFQENGLSQTQVYILQSVFALIIVILEVPSGYFADVYGRKLSLLMGALFATSGFLLYSFSHSFVPLLFAEVILGIGYSFISGADSAMAYDSLIAINKEREYRKFEAYSSSYMAISEGIASILGGLIAVVSIRLPVALQAGVYILFIPLVLLLKEPPRTKSESTQPLKDILDITWFVLYKNKEIKSLVFYGAVMSTLTHTMVWITQPYYQLIGIPIWLVWGVMVCTIICYGHFFIQCYAL